MTAKSVMEITRKTYTSITLLGDILGVVIPEWFNTLATGAIMAGEMFATLAAAETMSGFLAAKAVVTFGIATAMFTRAILLLQSKSEVERKLHSTLMLLNTWS